MKKLVTLLLCVLLILSLAACGSNKEDPKASNEVVIQVPADVMSMDPQWATDGQSFSAQNLCFAGLTALDADGNPVEDAAESISVSEDGCVYTFKLKENYWSNGEKVTAADYVYAWQRLVNPEFGSDYNWLLETANVVGGDAYDPESGHTPADLGIKAIDESTLEVTLTQPTGFFLQIVSFPSTFPLNQKFFESVGDQYALSLENMIFCGPYKMTSWDNGYGYSFELNEKYYDYENYKANYANKITFRIVADSQSALMEYEQGNLDYVSLSGAQVKANEGVEGFEARLGSYTFYLIENISYNKEGANNVTANLNVRKAISYAIDREDIATALNDGSVAAAGLVPFKLAANPETGKDFREDAGALVEFNQAKAKECLEAAKAELGKDTITLDLMYSSDQGDPEITAATRIAAQLEEVGFTVTLNAQPKKTRLNVYQHVNDAGTPNAYADFDVSLTRWGPDYGDPQTYMDLFIGSNTSNNNGGYKSDLYDECIKTAESAGTSAIDRWNKFIEAEKFLVAEDFGIAPVYQNGGACLINPRMSGIEFHSASVDVFRHIVVK